MNLQISRIGWAMAAVLVFITSEALAGPGWTNFGAIMELNQQPESYGAGAGQIFVDVSVTSNPSGCSVPTGFYFSVNDERHKLLFATLLAAQLSSRNVRIWTTGTCHVWGYAELDGIVVQ